MFLSSTTTFDVAAPLLAYPLLWLGIHLPLQRVRVHATTIPTVCTSTRSPAQQLLAIWGAYRLGYWAYLFLGIRATVPFAVASWWLVKRHALRLKKLRFRGCETRDSGSDLYASAGAGAIPTWRGYRGYHRALSSGPMHREIDVEAKHAATPGCAHITHLNNAGAALPTRATLEAVIGHLRREAERGGYEAATAASAQLEEVLHAVCTTDRSRTRRDRAHRLGHPGVDEGDVGVRTRGRHLER